MEQQKQLKKRMYSLIRVIILILVLLTGTTLAWFTYTGNSSVNITPVAGTISKGDANLLISSSKGGPFEKSCELIFRGGYDSLQPVSTADLVKFSAAVAHNKDGIAVVYKELTAEDVNKITMHGTVYLKSENGGSDVYIDRTNLDLGGDTQLLAAMRLGLIVTTNSESKTYIFRADDLADTSGALAKATVPTAGTVVSSLKGTGANYVADPALPMGDYFCTTDGEEVSPGKTVLCTLPREEVATVEFFYYIEGCDENRYNPAQNRQTALKLAFGGVDTDLPK